MNNENLVLAKVLVAIAKNPAYNDDQAAARVTILLQQVQRAALADLLQPLREIGNAAGCFASLRSGPYGWSCQLRAQDGVGLVMTNRDPLFAVDAAHREFERRTPPPPKPAETLDPIQHA